MSRRVRKETENTSNKTRWILCIVLIGLIGVIFAAARGNFQSPLLSKTVSTVLMPFQGILSWSANQALYVKNSAWDIMTVHEQNQMLRNEVNELRTMNAEASEYYAENQRLRALLGYKQTARQFDFLAASIIGRDSATWSSTVIINRGTKDGVQENMVVVTEKGLVGHIVEAGPVSSKVQLILDPRSSVGTIVQRAESRMTGTVEGDMDNPTMPKMVNIPKTGDVQEGDVVVTSGFGGVYPKGLMVGIVSSLQNDPGGLLKIALLEPAVDFQKLEDVMVIVASREAPPQPLTPPVQTPGTETQPPAPTTGG